jgi:hypothetical protein
VSHETIHPQFVNEALGVTSVVRPVGHFSVIGDFKAPVAMVSFGPVTLGQRELAQKMLMAVGLSPFLLIEFPDLNENSDQAQSEFFGAFQGRGVWIFGEAPREFWTAVKGSTKAYKTLELPALRALLGDADDKQVLELKKKVWAQLKSFEV